VGEPLQVGAKELIGFVMFFVGLSIEIIVWEDANNGYISTKGLLKLNIIGASLMGLGCFIFFMKV